MSVSPHDAIELDGVDVTGSSPHEMLRAGIGHVPEDRQRDGLVLPMSIEDNLVLDIYERQPFARFGSRDLGAVHANALEKLQAFDIRATSVEVPVKTLSGGNQQKVVVARELSRGVKLLVASQPTRGLDVGSIEYVHRRVVEERDKGVAVLIVSSELDEVLALGDRVAVMFRGKIVGIADPSVDRETIGLMMAGSGPRADEPIGVAAGAGAPRAGQPER